MKKVLFALLAVAALSSCSNEQTLELNPGDAIEFGNAFVENSTRAAADPSLGTTTNPFTSFNVWGTANGVAIYAGEAVTGTVGTGNEWTCSKKNYWVKDVAYKFAAVANGTVATLADGLPATISYTADGVTDLIYAENFGDDIDDDDVLDGIIGQPAGSNSPVEFTFSHLLAKAKFTVTTNASVAGYSYEVTNIKIANAYESGTYTVANNTWAGVAGAGNGQTFGDIIVNSTTQTAECAQEKLLIPITGATVSYTVTLKYNGSAIWSENKSHTAIANLAAANAYNFTIAVNVGEEIKFSVIENAGWTTNPDITIE